MSVSSSDLTPEQEQVKIITEEAVELLERNGYKVKVVNYWVFEDDDQPCGIYILSKERQP